MLALLKRLNDRLYSKETENLLNYVTLQIRGKELNKAMWNHFVKHMKTAVKIVICSAILSLVLACYYGLVTKTGHPFLIVTRAILVLISLLAAGAIRFNLGKLFALLPLSFLILECVGTALIYQEMLPEVFL